MLTKCHFIQWLLILFYEAEGESKDLADESPVVEKDPENPIEESVKNKKKKKRRWNWWHSEMEEEDEKNKVEQKDRKKAQNHHSNFNSWKTMKYQKLPI